ncbi:MAG: SRPBCC domain-containing protein [Chloroflexota bacterium]
MPDRSDASSFEIVRTYDRPLAEVWAAWSTRERLAAWWGPIGCTVEIPRFEFRPGGLVHYALRFNGAPTVWGRFNYREIVLLQRIVCLDSFANEYGGIARAPFDDRYPLEIETTVEFRDENSLTAVALRAEPFGALVGERGYFDDLRSSLNEGYGGTFDRLAGHLSGT